MGIHKPGSMGPSWSSAMNGISSGSLDPKAHRNFPICLRRCLDKVPNISFQMDGFFMFFLVVIYHGFYPVNITLHKQIPTVNLKPTPWGSLVNTIRLPCASSGGACGKSRLRFAVTTPLSLPSDAGSSSPGWHGSPFLGSENPYKSKNFPTYPWNIPQTPNQRFMKEFLPFGGLGIPGVLLQGYGMLVFS